MFIRLLKTPSVIGSLMPVRPISTTEVLFAEPLKKKRKMDPVEVKQKLERRLKRLEKQIRKWEKGGQELRPIDEYLISPTVQKERDLRTRTEDYADIELKHKKITKIWALYCEKERKLESKSIQRLMAAQEKALDQLQRLSPKLYERAVSIDPDLIPFKDDRILTVTPRIEGYVQPDGHWKDVTKVWEA